MGGADIDSGLGPESAWRWDVALSFAGPQRDYVQQVAEALKAYGMRCFYDADEEIDLWGRYLAEELPVIYSEQAAVVVVFVSADYAARDYPRLERRAALDRALRERREFVLPARFDDSPLPGLLSSMVTVDLRGQSPQQFAVRVIAKMGALGITARIPTKDKAAWETDRNSWAERSASPERVREFFVSYDKADQAWAEWIAWVLEEEGHEVLLQAWDFVPSANWVSGMQTGARNSDCMIVVLSAAYLNSVYGSREWRAAMTGGRDEGRRRLLVARTEDCRKPDQLLAMVGADLFKVSEREARSRLREMIAAAGTYPAESALAPRFPGIGQAANSERRLIDAGTANDNLGSHSEVKGARFAHTRRKKIMAGAALAVIGLASIIFVAFDASRASDTTLRWSYPTGAPVDSSPAIAGATVYIGSDNGNLYAVNASTGALRWSYPTGANVYARPTVTAGTVYIGSDNGMIYAVNASTGHLRWSYPTRGPVDSSPAVVGDTVYIGSNDEKVYALNAVTGHLRWTYSTKGVVFSSPSVADGTVYIGSDDHNVYALNAVTGHLRWNYLTGGPINSSPAVADGTVYIGSEDHKVYALDAKSGYPRWSYPTRGPIDSSPAVADGTAYIGSDDGDVYALDTDTGRLRWSSPTGENAFIWPSPAVAGGTVYIGSSDSKVYALGAGNGRLLWSYTTGGTVFSSPAVADGTVYFGSGDGYVYALTWGQA